MTNRPAPGRATPEGTSRYRQRFEGHAFREASGLWLPTIGLGTYLGNHDDATDERYRGAIRYALGRGCNLIDTAINYRCQRSERVVGRALAEALAQGMAERDEVVISTKGGFLPFDGQPPGEVQAYVQRNFIDTGVCPAESIVDLCHSMDPEFLSQQCQASLANLGLETVDIYLLHNPEQQRRAIDEETFYERVTRAFERFEALVAQGKIGVYGVATWHAFRVAPDEPEYVSLERLLDCARHAGGDGHHFGAIQVPYNMAMTEALTTANQTLEGETLSVLDAADRLGLVVLGSASLLQRQLTDRLPDHVVGRLGHLATDAQRALEFARSAPGLTTALVGASRIEHVEEDLAVSSRPPLDLAAYARLFDAHGDQPT